MTLGLFWRLLDRANLERRAADRRSGEIAAMIFNAYRKEGVEGWDWTNVFPEWREERREMTDEEMFQNMLAWSRIPATKRN